MDGSDIGTVPVPPATVPALADARQAWAFRASAVFLVVVGFAVRLLTAHYSLGSNDVITWQGFAAQVRAQGVLQEYVTNPNFNHPPLMGYLARLCLWTAELTGIRFSFVFKLPMIAADMAAGVAVAYLALRKRGPRSAVVALGLYAVNPLSTLIAAHHGNTDCLGAALIVVAAVLAGECHASFASGVALGAAVNVKLIAVFCIPALLFGSPRSRKELLLTCAGLAVGVLPFLPILVVCWSAFHRNAIAYNSFVGNWGVVYLLRTLGQEPHFAAWAEKTLAGYQSLGRKLIELTSVFLPLYFGLSRRATLYQLMAVSMSLFLILAPGFGIQYLAFVVPILFAASRSWGASVSFVGGIFAALTYLTFWTGTLPAHSNFNSDFAPSVPLFGGFTWGLLVVFVCQTLLGALRSRPLAIKDGTALFARFGSALFRRRTPRPPGTSLG